MQQVLLLGTSSSSPPCADPSSLHATSSPEAVVDAQVRWLETFVAGLWEKNAFEASAPVGLVVAWHLNNRNTGNFFEVLACIFLKTHRPVFLIASTLTIGI